MGKSAPAPDYQAAAQSQAQANQQTAQYNNNVNRVDQYTPLGSSTWTIRQGADPKNPQPGDYVQTTSLSPQQQSLLDTNTAAQLQLSRASQAGVQRAVDAMGQPIPEAAQGLSSAPGVRQTAQAGQGLNMSAPQQGALTTGVSTDGLPQVGGDYGAQRDQVVSALMSRINPDLEQARTARETDLANRGIEVGSTAYDRAESTLGRTENDARMGAVLAGGQEQTRLANLAMAGRGQLFSEGQTNAGLNNSTQNQAFTQGLASAQFGNQAQGQQYSQQSSQDAAINALLRGDTQFNNQLHSQQTAENLAMRQAPLNEVNALRTGNQVTQPTFSNYYSSGSAAAPVFDAAVAGGNAAAANTAQQNASANATYAAIASIIASY